MCINVILNSLLIPMFGSLAGLFLWTDISLHYRSQFLVLLRSNNCIIPWTLYMICHRNWTLFSSSEECWVLFFLCPLSISMSPSHIPFCLPTLFPSLTDSTSKEFYCEEKQRGRQCLKGAVWSIKRFCLFVFNMRQVTEIKWSVFSGEEN